MNEDFLDMSVDELHQNGEEREKTDPLATAQKTIDALKGVAFHGHPRFYELLVKMADLHSRKNHDYAGKGNPLRNFYKCREQGIEPWRGVMVRLSDKWSRLESFCRQGKLEVKGESVVDTLMDNAVYSLLAILLFEEEYGKGKEYYDSITKMIDKKSDE